MLIRLFIQISDAVYLDAFVTGLYRSQGVSPSGERTLSGSCHGPTWTHGTTLVSDLR